MTTPLEVTRLDPTGFAGELRLAEGVLQDLGALHERLRSALARHPVLALRTAGLDRAQLVSIVSAFGFPQAQVLREHRLAENPMVW